MNCPTCQHHNPASARFCNQCGDALPIACSSCGSQNPATAKFCNQCGLAVETKTSPKQPANSALQKRSPKDYTPIHLAERILGNRSAMEGERKQVTVLFADLKGSTELASKLDPEEWHQILDRYFEILADGIHQFEGTINQYTGDGVMALFGAPVAHEDHALRACFASLKVQELMAQFSDELRLSQGIDLSARIGLNSGEVVVGRIGDDLRMDYTAQGHTVNLAARMEQIAAPGKIFLTRDTARFVDGYCNLRDLGESRVKGSDEAIQVYELTGTGQLSTRLERSKKRGFSTFIGRENEYQKLHSHLDMAAQSKPQVVAIVGDAGLGKSRLCHEFTADVASRGIRVLKGTGIAHGQAVPLFPVVGLLKDAFDIADTDDLESQRRKVAGTLALMADSCPEDRALMFELLGIPLKDGESTDLGPEKRIERLANVARSICLPNCDEVTVLLIEDWHWLDDPSRNFLHLMLERTTESEQQNAHDDCNGHRKFLLLVNHRPDTQDEHLACHLNHCIELKPLQDSDLQQLLHEWMGESEALGALADRLVTMAAGNPFFIEEAMQSLIEDGSLEGKFGNYRITRDVDSLSIPATVEAVLAARIDRLTGDQKDILQTAAVIGRNFSAALLSEISELDDSVVEQALQTLIKGNYIFEVADEAAFTPGIRELAFRHPLTRDVAYKSQLRDRRQRLHQQLATIVEGQLDNPDDPGELALFLAHHWAQTEQLNKTAHWALKSAQWSALRDLEQSVKYFRQAAKLTAIDSLDDSDPQLVHTAIAARAGVIRADALFNLPKDEVENAWLEGKQLANQYNDQFGFTELLLAEGARRLHSGNADEAVKVTSQALDIVHATGNSALEARFRIPILLSHFGAGQLQQGLDSLGGDWDTVPIDIENFGSRAFRALIIAYQGKLAEARREIDQCLRIGANEGRSVSWMHANLVDINYFGGQQSDTQHHAQLAVQNAEEYGSPFFRIIAYLAMADALIQRKRFSEARQLLEKHRDLTRPNGPVHQYEGVHLCTIAACLISEGEWQEGLGLTEQAIETSESAHWRIWEGRARLESCRALRLCYGEDGGDHLAHQYEKIESLIQLTSAELFRPYLYLEQSKFARTVGNVEHASTLLQQAHNSFELCGAIGHAQNLQKFLPQTTSA